MTTKIYGTTGTKKDGLLSTEQQKALDRRQSQCAKRVQDYWGGSNGNGLYPEIAMPTGFGKGRVVHRLLKSSKHDKILTIVGSKNILLNQSREVLEGLAIEDTGEANFSILPDLSGRVVLGTWQGLTSFSRKHTNRPDFGLVVIDEVHNVGTHQRMEILKWLKPEHVVGLTATAHRASGGFRSPEDYGFSVVDSMPLPECIDKRWLSPLMGLCIDTQVMLPAEVRQQGQLNQKKMSQALRKYPHIFLEIANDIAERFLPSGMKTVIVVNRVDQEACVIAEELMRQGFKVGLAVNQNAAKRLSDRFITLDAIRRYKLPHSHPDSIQILISPQVIGEGFDAPATECVIWAAPTLSHVRYTQVIGRGSRRCWQKKYCLIVDYVYLIENYGYSYNFAQFFKKEDMREVEGGFMYVGPKENGHDIKLPSRFNHGGKIVSVIDLRKLVCPSPDGWLTRPEIAQLVGMSGPWIDQQLNTHFPKTGEKRRGGTRGKTAIYYPPAVVEKLKQLSGRLPAKGWLNSFQLSKLVGRSNTWVEPQLAQHFIHLGEMRAGRSNNISMHYPPIVTKKLAKLAKEHQLGEDWKTVRQLTQITERSERWVTSRLSEFCMIKDGQIKLDRGGRPTLHYPPSVSKKLSHLAKAHRDAKGWLPVRHIANTVNKSFTWVKNYLEQHFSQQGEMRIGQNRKISMHYPPFVLEKIKEVISVIKSAGDWLACPAIAKATGKSVKWVKSRLKDKSFEKLMEMRSGVLNNVFPHYPPSIVDELKKFI